MNKKAYQQPQLHCVNIRVENLLQASVSGVSSNVGFSDKVLGGSGSARSRGFDDWDDEE